MTRAVSLILVGVILGALLSTPVSAQMAIRLWATLSTNLTSGTSTPLICTANGAGCMLNIQLH